ncbi:MAG: hypothetical protein ACE5JA_10545 [bacterium]
MPIANYSTTVDALKTVGEIQGILVAHGARSILMNYGKDGSIESLSFIVETPYGDMPIRLPIDARAVLKVLEEQRVPPRYANYPQAVRIAWRIVKDWVRAQMAILETEMVKMEQIFLPYMITKNNQTLYESMVDRGFYLTEGKRDES